MMIGASLAIDLSEMKGHTNGNLDEWSDAD
jgi:hypothetical protein